MRTIIIVSLLGLITVLGILLGFPTNCSISIGETWKNIFIGALTSSFVVLFIETIALIRDSRKFWYLRGTFKRIEIYNKLAQRKDDKIYEEITQRYIDKKVNSIIKIKSRGDGQFEGTADYEEGKVKFDIVLDKVNPSYGLGTYQYISKKEKYILPDLGKYETIRDKVNQDRIFLHYNNILPSGLAEGYEIWERS